MQLDCSMYPKFYTVILFERINITNIWPNPNVQYWILDRNILKRLNSISNYVFCFVWKF